MPGTRARIRYLALQISLNKTVGYDHLEAEGGASIKHVNIGSFVADSGVSKHENVVAACTGSILGVVQRVLDESAPTS